MQSFKKVLASLLAVTLVLTSVIGGLVLPVAAEGDTFKLAKDVMYVAPSTGNTMYVAVAALTPDGKAYEETLTWTTSNSSVVAFDNAGLGRFKSAKTPGTAIITATNSAGESHSCTVHVTWDGERVSGGDFETPATYQISKWTSEIAPSTSTTRKVVKEEGSENHALELASEPNGAARFHYYLPAEANKKYVFSFDIKGDTGEIKAVSTNATHTTVFGSSKASYSTSGWQYIVPKADEWTHYEFYIQTKASPNYNYIFGLGNVPISGNDKRNPVYFDNISIYELGTAESVTIDTAAQSLAIGESKALSYTALPEDATVNRAQWTSSNEAVAKVDENGKVTAVGLGTATVTLKCGLLTSSCEVTVTKAVATGIELDKTAVELSVGDTETVTASIVPADAEWSEAFTWKTSNAAVATVSEGQVTAVGAGVAVITVESGDFSAACAVRG